MSEPGPRGGTPRARPPGVVRLGTVAGIPVHVRPSWFLVAALIAVLMGQRIELVAPGLGDLTYVAGAAFAVLLYLSVLLHEVSHALAAKSFGHDGHSIELHFLGGVTTIEEEATTARREAVIAGVGPLTSLAVGGVCWVAAPFAPDGLMEFTVQALAGANLVIGALNLLPGLPLDGGRVLRAAVWGATGRPLTGTVAAGWGAAASPAWGWRTRSSRPLRRHRVQTVDILLGGGARGVPVDRCHAGAGGGPAASPAADAAGTGPRPAGARGAARPAARRGRAPRPGAGGRRPGGAVVRRPARWASSTSAPCRPRRPTAGRGCRPGRWRARIEPGLLLPADLVGEALVRAMQRTPGQRVRPGRARRIGLRGAGDVRRRPAFAT